MTRNDIMEDDPQDLQDNPDKYVDLNKLAGDCNGSYEKTYPEAGTHKNDRSGRGR